MATTTALALMTTAFQALNIFQSGEAVPSADAQDALILLNNMIGAWALQNLTLPITTREVFSMTAGKGGPNAPYTIGPGGNFDTVRPPDVASILGVAILLGNTTPNIEMPRALVTDEQYEAIRVKDLSTALFTVVYYRTTYAGGFGALHFWPVPNTTLHSFVLYRRQPLSTFPSLSASYDVPTGYEDAIVYNLAQRLAIPYGKTLSPDLQQLARSSLAMIKRTRLPMLDLPVDPLLVLGQAIRSRYNILTGTDI